MDKDKLVIYQINPNMFTHEGTLNAAKKMLPHIASLGVNVAYLFAICKSDTSKDRKCWSERQKKSKLNNPKNPYRIDDYFTIDEDYGGNEQLHAFVDEAHQLGLKVMLDLVYVHCGPNSKLFQDCPEGVKRNPDGSIHYTLYHFPETNFESRALREYFIENMLYFVREFEIDGFRCDVGDCVPLDFWKEAVERVRQVKDDIIMLNEGFNPEYVLSGVFDLNYNSPILMMTELNFPTYFRALREEIDKKGIDRKGIYFLENHDTVTDNGRADLRFSPKACDCAYVHLFTAAGTPLLYCGEEIADLNVHNMFANKTHNRGYGIDWSNALLPHGKRRLALIKKLGKIRQEEEALAKGVFNWIETREDAIAYERVLPNERIVVYINWGRKPLEIMNHNGKILLSRGYKESKISSNGFVIMKLDKEYHRN